jgi:hypothetical protein
MYIYILPISGGRFPNQLAGLRVIGRTGIKPDVVMACSGGNICAYSAMYADWLIDKKMDMILQNLYNLLSIETWTSPMFNFLPNAISLFRYGTVFKSIGNENTFKRCYTTTSIKKTEIWTNVFNCLHDRMECFCNMGPDEAILKPDHVDPTYALPPVYMDGNIDTAYLVSKASASVPTIFPQVWINNQPYSDGGVVASSPLVYFGPTLQKLMKTQPIHFIYMNPRPLKNSFSYDGDSINYTMKMMILNMGRFNLFSDEVLIRTLMASFGEIHTKVIDNGTDKDLIQWYENQKYYLHSFLEMTPKSNYHIDILNVDQTRISEIVDEVSENYAIRLWWVEKDKCEKDIHQPT